VAEGAATAVEALRTRPTGSTRAQDAAPKVAFCFPGQGSQHVGMARELYEHEPVFHAELERVAELAAPRLGVDLRHVLFPPAGEEALGRATAALTAMRISQPALFAVEYAMARQLQEWGITPEVVLGHSLGAYAAATIAGVLDVADAVALVLRRSELLDSLPAGSMIAVALPAEQLVPRLGPGSSIAAVNGPAQCVVTGPAAEVSRLAAELAAAGTEVRPLHISAAAHSTFVDAVTADFQRCVAQVVLNPPAIPWISDRTGQVITDEEATDPAYWAGHLRHTVQFSDALSTLLAEPGVALLEVGPGRTLGTLARRHPAYDPGVPVVASLPHPADPTDNLAFALGAVGRLWQSGAPVDWAALHSGERRRRVPLPTYPFERQRYVLEPVRSVDVEPAAAGDARHLEFPRPELEQDFVRVATGTEAAVAAAFGDVLGMREVGAHDDFFDLGGDSLVATRLLLSIKDSVGAELSVRDLFAAPTVTELAQRIDVGLAA
jgi:phthiocerol/phenolphthiocerol synthesis type-I polyketide synthase E